MKWVNHHVPRPGDNSGDHMSESSADVSNAKAGRANHTHGNHVQGHASHASGEMEPTVDTAGIEFPIESALMIGLRRRWPVATKYMQDLWLERTILLFFGLLFFIALSVSLLLLTLSFIYNPDVLVTQPLAVGVVGSSPAFAPLLANQKVSIYEYPTMDAALFDFDAGAITAVFSAHVVNGSTIVDAVLPSSPVASAVVLSISKSAFADAEESMERARLNDPGLVWSRQLHGNAPVTRGANTLFEIILGLIIPLFVLIPAFVIGNLFVDTLTQEFEQKLHQTIFSAISPVRYVIEYLMFGTIANVAVVFLFVGLLFLRFSFVKNFALVLVYAFAFGLLLFLFALNCSFYLRRKEVAQTVYSFGVVAVFLLSPFFSFSPLFTLTELLLGNTYLFSLSILLMLMGCGLLFWLLLTKLRQDYYL